MMEFFFKADTLIIADNTILVQNETVFLKGCFVRTVLIQDECCSHCTTEKVLRSYNDYRTKLCYLEVLVEGRLYGDFTLVRTSLRQKDTGPERGTRAER